jgi:hypothetical protein
MSDLNTNMDLWNRVRTIDQKYTKQAKLNGQNITSFSLQSVLLMATEQFGMFGYGWGYEIEQERFDEGAIITPKASWVDGDGKTTVQEEVKEITHTLTIRFWYKIGGEKIICPVQAGHTPYLMGTKYGPKHDGEYYKKTLADAIKKSLSMLGFGADIFLGLNDDPHYIAMMQEQNALVEQAKLPEKIDALADRVNVMCDALQRNTGASLTAAATNYGNEILTTARRLNLDPAKFTDKLQQAYDKRIESLKATESK